MGVLFLSLTEIYMGVLFLHLLLTEICMGVLFLLPRYVWVSCFFSYGCPVSSVFSFPVSLGVLFLLPVSLLGCPVSFPPVSSIMIEDQYGCPVSLLFLCSLDIYGCPVSFLFLFLFLSFLFLSSCFFSGRLKRANGVLEKAFRVLRQVLHRKRW